MEDLSALGVREEFDYDPTTGNLRWKTSGRGRNVGEVAGFYGNPYWRVKVRGRAYYAHRLVWAHVHGVWPSGEIDHINEIKTDNRISNLRDATRSVNMTNISGAQRNNKIGYRGVTSRRGGFMVKFRNKWVGDYPTLEQAVMAYTKAKEGMS